MIKPLKNKIFIKPDKVDNVTKSGIVLPGKSNEKPHEGIVVAVYDSYDNGRGKKIKPAVIVGDKILYSKYSGSDISFGGTDYMIIKEDDICLAFLVCKFSIGRSKCLDRLVQILPGVGCCNLDTNSGLAFGHYRGKETNGVNSAFQQFF